MHAMGFRQSDADENMLVLPDSFSLHALEDARQVLEDVQPGPGDRKGHSPKRLKAFRSLIELAKRASSIVQEYMESIGKSLDDANPVLQKLGKACNVFSDNMSAEGVSQEVKQSFKELGTLLCSESGVTAHEIKESGLFDTLAQYITCATSAGEYSDSVFARQQERLLAFVDELTQVQEEGVTAHSGLIMILEHLKDSLSSEEHLPVYSHEMPSSRRGLQALSWPLKFRLERAPGASTLKDLTGTTVRMESIASGQDLYGWLQSQVVQKWHEGRERGTLEFIQEAQQRAHAKESLQLLVPDSAIAAGCEHAGLVEQSLFSTFMFHCACVSSMPHTQLS